VPQKTIASAGYRGNSECDDCQYAVPRHRPIGQVLQLIVPSNA
jgi:hypothetical protein